MIALPAALLLFLAAPGGQDRSQVLRNGKRETFLIMPEEMKPEAK